MEPLRILLIGGEQRLLGPLERLLSERRYEVEVAVGMEPGLLAHRDRPPDLVLVVLPLGARSSKVMAGLLSQDSGTPVIVGGTDADIAGADSAFELGASEYVGEPLRATAALLSAIGVVLGVRKNDAQLKFIRQREAASVEWQLVSGQCAQMQEVMQLVHQICRRSAAGLAPTILISGETGTGKGILAKYIHYNGSRRNQPLVDLNCAALPPTLVESELFGHERGAFTGARTARAGLVETADGGTLFLDEIASLPLDLQAKLLTVIDQKQVRRIGARQPVRVDAQIIAASNRDLGQMVSRGEFRMDLYHRLNVVALTLPPLRERGDDAVLMAEAFTAALCREHAQPIRTLTERARRMVRSYRWPGNIRELRNVLERIIFLDDSSHIDVGQLNLGGAGPDGDAQVVIENEGRGLRVSLPDGGVPLERLEREILQQVLLRHHGNVSRAARYLSISRQTLIYRIKKHGLGPHGDGRRAPSPTPTPMPATAGQGDNPCE